MRDFSIGVRTLSGPLHDAKAQCEPGGPEDGKYPAVLGKKRALRMGAKGDFPGENAGLAGVELLQNAALAVDEGSDAGVRATDEWETGFGGAEEGVLEVLLLDDGVVEEAVVSEIEEDVSSGCGVGTGE